MLYKHEMGVSKFDVVGAVIKVEPSTLRKRVGATLEVPGGAR